MGPKAAAAAAAVAAAAVSALPSVTLSTQDLAIGVLIQILNIPATKLKLIRKPEQIVPSAVLASGAKIQGPVSVAKLLVTISGNAHSEWLGVTDADKAKVEEQMVHAGSLTAKLEKQETFTETMKDLNGFLTTRVFFATNYFTLADVFLYSTLYLPVSKLNKQGRLSFCHVTRYFDLVQHLCHEAGTVKLTELVDIDLNAPPDEKPLAQEKKKEKAEAADGKAAKKADKGAAASSAQAKPAESSKETKKEGRKDATPAADADKKEKKAAPPDGKAAPEKAEKKKAEKAPAEAAPAPPEGTPEPERFDMRVGYIISAKRHPQADTLYVEEVDLGEPTPRTVVSGLVKWMPETELQGRKVVLLCNLKPAKMRGIESQAMVLAATAADGSCVELLDAPEGSKPGDRCWFDNHIGTDFSQLNPKKKIFETVQPHLKTDSMKRAVYVVEVAGVRHLNVLRCDSGEITVRTVVGGSIK